MTFVFGLFAFLAWLYVTGADKTAKDLLRKSFKYFIVGGLLLAIPPSLALLLIDEREASWGYPIVIAMALVIVVLAEEILKLWASRSESSGLRAFALVALFGIIELVIRRPILLLLNTSGQDVNELLLAVNALPALTLHTFTAVIYGFYWRRNPVAQLFVCSLMHLAFNVSADVARYASDGAWLLIIAPLSAAIWWLFPKKNSGRRGEWCAPEKRVTVSG